MASRYTYANSRQPHTREPDLLNSLKLRRLLITIHLWLAGLLAPAFLVVAISGGLYLAGFHPEAEQTPIELQAGSSLDFAADDLEDQVRDLLERQGLDVSFEYVRQGGNWAMTRPTTRTYIRFQQGAEGLEATLNRPNFQYVLMELHKGHGPRAYRLYQIAVALVLFLVVVGGLAVGLLARTYRRPTLIAVGAGTILTISLSVFA